MDTAMIVPTMPFVITIVDLNIEMVKVIVVDPLDWDANAVSALIVIVSRKGTELIFAMVLILITNVAQQQKSVMKIKETVILTMNAMAILSVG